MDAVLRLQQDVREGRIGAEGLLALVVTLQRELQAARGELQAARGRIEEQQGQIDELRKKLGVPAKFAEPFSLRAEEQRQEARGKTRRKKTRPTRRGRITTAEKIRQAERTEDVFPAGVAASDCKLSHTRPMWRLERGRAVLVAYNIHRGPRNQFGQIPGVLGRCEFSLEIILAIAYQVYIVGLSFDKVCMLMGFFQNLRLRKSQVDALLNQLARHWAGEFERLCTLLANSAVVHADETSWSLNSVWAFLSEQVRVLLFGVHKDADTLQAILDPATFAGIVVSDDAAVYRNFTHSQKCWAHLLRKAIKLTLLEPANTEYRRFADRLLEIYRAACRVQRDGRLGDAGRAKKVAALDDELLALCEPVWFAEPPPGTGAADDYRLLCHELMRLMLARQLFTFATAEAVATPQGDTTLVAGTNNEAERTLRGPATARKTGRTNKTPAGARRQTIVVSVLESLRCHLPTFTLSTVIAEIQHWCNTGRSRFEELITARQLTSPVDSILDRVLPVPSG
jgi:hypothetical protein